MLLLQEQRENPPGRGTGGIGELLATRSVKPLEGEIGEQSPDQ